MERVKCLAISFIKECARLLKFLVELNKVIEQIEKNYLDDFNMSDAEKDEFDMECRLQNQQYFKKFEFLENYEMERHSLSLKDFSQSLTDGQKYFPIKTTTLSM